MLLSCYYAEQAARFAKPGARNPAYLYPELLAEAAELVEAVAAYELARANVPGEVEARLLAICHEAGDCLWFMSVPREFGLPGLAADMLPDDTWSSIVPCRSGPMNAALELLHRVRVISSHQAKCVRDPEDAGRRQELIAACFSPELPRLLASVVGHFGLTLEDCAKYNLDMLSGRKARGTIGGLATVR